MHVRTDSAASVASKWIDDHHSELVARYNRRWVAAGRNGLLADAPSSDELLRILRTAAVPLHETAISYISNDLRA